MARIRSIKPEFWTDPDVVAMPMATRLFFIGCWNHADDYGVLRDDPERLRLQIMPADDVDADAMVDELVKRRHLVRMTAPDGTALLVVRTFCVHQKIDKRAAGRWGRPEDFTTGPDPSPPDPHQSPPLSTLEGKGGEGSKDTREPTTPRTRTGSGATGSSSDDDGVFDDWWKLYPRKVDRKNAATAYAKSLKRRGVTPDLLTERLNRQKAAWQREQRPDEKIPHASTWLNGERYNDDDLANPPQAVNPRGPIEQYR